MSYPFDFERPKAGLIGHRGVAARCLENTLAGFALAHSLGFDCIECDVQLCSSGELLIFHDDTTERLSNHALEIRTSDISSLRALSLHADKPLPDLPKALLNHFPNDKARQTIPLLGELLTLCHHLGLRLNLEMKCIGENEEALAKAVGDALSKQWPSHAPLPLISSFEHGSLDVMRELHPDLPLGFLVEKPDPITINHVLKERNCSLNYWAKYHDSILVNELIKKVPLTIYTVNEIATIHRLLTEGIYGIFTDFPITMGEDIDHLN